MRLLLLLLLPALGAALHIPTLEQIGDFMGVLLGGGRAGEGGPEASGGRAEGRSGRARRQDTGIGDESRLAWEVKASKLPMRKGPDGRDVPNDRYMPVLSNGHLAVTVYNDSLFLQGLFNGVGGESHRAAIPAAIMGRIELISEEQESRAKRTYSFNARTGVYTEFIDCDIADIYHRVYVHSKYIRLLVSDIHAVKKEFGGVFNVLHPDLVDTEDVDFDQRREYRGEWRVSGQTRTAEAGAVTERVHVYWQEPLSQVRISDDDEVRIKHIMAVDKSEAGAQTDFDIARDLRSEDLLKEHEERMESIWQEGLVETEGNDLPLNKAVWFAQHYLLGSMSPVDPAYPPQHSEVLLGVGRTSLGKGRQGRDYQGHVFWDNEIYLLPAVVLFHPELAKKMLRYRGAKSQMAKTHAELTGDLGMRFPWESAVSGFEVTPEGTCDGCRERQIHNTGAVAWAIRTYFSATRDRDYVKDPIYQSCSLTREIARFYANRAQYNTSIGRYDIRDVMGPDDFHDHVDNSAYTNVLASLAIHWARYYACACNTNEKVEVPDEWIQKALFLELPYDNVKRLHAQYSGFDAQRQNITNKQADTILLTFPLNWNMSWDIARNDLEYYELITDLESPAMTWSFMAAGFKWVGNLQKARSYFYKSYQDYMISPFKIWTEYNERSSADQESGSVNYLPGMGAFLQSVVYGYGGVRIRPEALEFHNPMPPPDCTHLRLSGLKYLGARFNITIQQHSVEVKMLKPSQEYTLVLRRNVTDNSGEVPLDPYDPPVEISPANQGFFIYATNLEACEHPRDYIYMPWGYSPWISAAPQRRPAAPLLVAMVTAYVILLRLL